MIVFSRLDFDPRHDGAVIAPAVALHLGYVMFKDAFGLYGPISPWIQSIALMLPPGSVLSLRYANAIFIAITIFFMADLGRIAPKNWNLTQRATVTASLAWLFLCDVYFGTTMHPWSSVIAGLLSMGGLYFIAVSQNNSIRRKKLRTFIYGAISGLLFGLLPFVKINIGLASIFALLVAFIISTLFKRSLLFNTYASVFFGILISTSIVIIQLVTLKTFGKFLDQSVLFPLSQSSMQIEGWRTWENLTRMFLQQILFSLLLVLVAIVSRSESRFSNRRFSLATISIASGLVIVLGEWVLAIAHFRAREPETQFQIYKIFPYLNEKFLSFFMVSSVLALFSLFIWSLIKIGGMFRRSNYTSTFLVYIFYILMSGIGLGLLIQIVPTWDTRHVWWGLPVGLVLLFSAMEKFCEIRKISLITLLLPLAVVAAMASVSGFENLNKPRELMTEIPFAYGMHLPVAQKLVLRDDAQFLKDNLGLENKAIFLVWHGYLSVINGKYQSSDLYFTVPEAAGPKLADRVGDGDPIVVEDAVYSDALDAEILDLGYGQCANTANYHLRIYKKNC